MEVLGFGGLLKDGAERKPQASKNTDESHPPEHVRFTSGASDPICNITTNDLHDLLVTATGECSPFACVGNVLLAVTKKRNERECASRAKTKEMLEIEILTMLLLFKHSTRKRGHPV
jgi:hypothetical protein